MLAKSVDDLEQEIKEELAGEYKHVSGMLNKMMDNPASWCKHYADKK